MRYWRQQNLSKTKYNYHDITAWKINIIKTPFKHEQAKQLPASNNPKIKFILCKLSFSLRIDFISW